jgi:hypothetical protein
MIGSGDLLCAGYLAESLFHFYLILKNVQIFILLNVKPFNDPCKSLPYYLSSAANLEADLSMELLIKLVIFVTTGDKNKTDRNFQQIVNKVRSACFRLLVSCSLEI